MSTREPPSWDEVKNEHSYSDTPLYLLAMLWG
jgi:hypothetical protein